MRGIYILSEGATEELFVTEILLPFFAERGIYDVRAILMETSPGHKGGEVSYQRYKRNAENLLREENDVIVTSLIDFFRLKPDFPDYAKARSTADKIQQVSLLEDAIASNINSSRFIPYIQLHEFEGLLFSSTSGFEYLPGIPNSNRKLLNDAVNEHENPEFLNDGAETAPSKRLEKLIPGYQKTFHGLIIAHEISLDVIMQKCTRFNNWVNTLLKRMQQI